MVIDLAQLKHGESGKIAEICGGHDFTRRIHALGIREGKTIKKISSHFWRGPQTVMVDSFQVAVGFGMAKKVMVEVDRSE